jgi:hypothetical protein
LKGGVGHDQPAAHLDIVPPWQQRLGWVLMILGAHTLGRPARYEFVRRRANAGCPPCGVFGVRPGVQLAALWCIMLSRYTDACHQQVVSSSCTHVSSICVTIVLKGCTSSTAPMLLPNGAGGANAKGVVLAMGSHNCAGGVCHLHAITGFDLVPAVNSSTSRGMMRLVRLDWRCCACPMASISERCKRRC